MIDWTSPTWGMAGHNVHEDGTGSWLHDNDNRRDEE